MRVLLVTHRFLPEHRAGTEQHVLQLARGLLARGHEVLVFTAHKDPGRKDLSLQSFSFEGIPCVRLIENMLLSSFEETWRRPRAEARFQEVLRKFRPEVTHVHHLMYGSLGYLELARAEGSALILTLHDFWLECGRMGQLLSFEGELCRRVDHERCGRCLARVAWRQPKGAPSVAACLRFLRRIGIDLVPLAQRIARRNLPPSAAESAEAAPSFARWAAQRETELVRAVAREAQVIVSPSHFLADRVRNLGLPRERIRVVPSGIPAGFKIRASHPPRSGPLRLLFLGSLVRAKGPDLLLEAWSLLPAGLRSGAELLIHGPGGHERSFEAALEHRARSLGVTLGGPLLKDGVAAAILAADLLVVPSRWFENRPTVILEALALGRPVLVANEGGMAELVEEGRNGWTFAFGRADDLARVLRRLLMAPGEVRALQGQGCSLPSFDDTIEGLLELYRAAREELALG